MWWRSQNARGAVGFLTDWRRLNVATTRARRQLAVVCDPTTVGADALLATLMDYVAEVGEWRPPQRIDAPGVDDDALLRGVVAPAGEAANARTAGVARRQASGSAATE